MPPIPPATHPRTTQSGQEWETPAVKAHLLTTHLPRSQNLTDIKEVVKPFDWSYTTPYAGTLSSTSASPSADTPPPTFEPTATPLPLHLLTLPDPILFFDDVVLYEDELADNGTALFSVKIRVMPARLLLLARFFLRLDGVVFRVRDTRVFVEFATGDVLREYTAREEAFGVVRRKLGGADATAAMREPAKLVEFLPVVERRLERLAVK